VRPNQATTVSSAQAGVDIILGVSLTIVSALAAAGLDRLLLDGQARIAGSIAIQGTLVLAGLRGLLAWRGQRWSDIGLVRPSVRDIPRALLAVALSIGANAAMMSLAYLISPQIVTRHSESLAGIANEIAGGLPFVAVALVLSLVGFYEELLSRGLLLARCRVLMGGFWGPVLASAVLFGAGHFYQGFLGILQTTVVGIVFAALAFRWGTLWPLIAAHIVLDVGSVAGLA
jgi:hypothetical protein